MADYLPVQQIANWVLNTHDGGFACLESSNLSTAKKVVTNASGRKPVVHQVVLSQASAGVQLAIGFDDASATFDGGTTVIAKIKAAGSVAIGPTCLRGASSQYIVVKADAAGEACAMVTYHYED